MTFSADKNKLCVPFKINDDNIALEGDETFEVTFTILSGSSTARNGSTLRSTVTIEDDDSEMKLKYWCNFSWDFLGISFRAKDIVVNETEMEAQVCVEKIGITDKNISLTIVSSDFNSNSEGERAQG